MHFVACWLYVRTLVCMQFGVENAVMLRLDAMDVMSVCVWLCMGVCWCVVGGAPWEIASLGACSPLSKRLESKAKIGAFGSLLPRGGVDLFLWSWLLVLFFCMAVLHLHSIKKIGHFSCMFVHWGPLVICTSYKRKELSTNHGEQGDYFNQLSHFFCTIEKGSLIFVERDSGADLVINPIGFLLFLLLAILHSP